ncbi:ABC transporter ATP-binding protein [Mangrovitalea sediminis]|uniref:ABC transporter ATP-binding protein n=1 Tax=Mangrovitalea sediminis TaxID=1982043 RepID=UPI000BE6111E|nr:ABC transporter ATP-binding protein [Mangrovitalea sediminis]
MIKVEQLSRYYGSFAAVKDVSFSIQSGEIVGLLGHNGAGKTTIMKMLMGYLEPSAGEIFIQGQDLQEHSLDLRREMGYLPELPPTYPEMILCDYLEYAAQLHGVPKDKRTEAVRVAMEKTALLGKALQPIDTLSRGYRQRVGVAQAIVHNPAMLILDEPTNGLDPAQIQHMRELIRGLRRDATVILSTHIMQEVNAVCDRVLIIRNGELALDATMEELNRSKVLRLVSDVPDAELGLIVRSLGIARVRLEQRRGTRHEYLLFVEEGKDAEQVAAEVADHLVERRQRIYALTPETRDLETVFREINEHATEGSHAA